jgi:CRP/FNR family transcriptional regulator, cyclic AMP receptor protein
VDRGLLGSVGTAERAGLVAAMRRRSFRRGETLFHEGDAGDLLFTIDRGRVAIQTTTALGDVVTLVILGRGDTFGEQALVDARATRTASAVALEPLEVRALHRRDFDELRARDPSVDRLLVDLLAQQVRRLSGLLQDALFLPADRRVLRRLVEVVAVYRTTDGPVEVPLRQDDLAAMAGTTRPTVNRLLRKLQHDGLVELHRGHVTVLDAATLAQRAR